MLRAPLCLALAVIGLASAADAAPAKPKPAARPNPAVSAAEVQAAADRLPRFDVAVIGDGRQVRVAPVNVDPAGKTLRLTLQQKDEVSPMIRRGAPNARSWPRPTGRSLPPAPQAGRRRASRR